MQSGFKCAWHPNTQHPERQGWASVTRGGYAPLFCWEGPTHHITAPPKTRKSPFGVCVRTWKALTGRGLRRRRPVRPFPANGQSRLARRGDCRRLGRDGSFLCFNGSCVPSACTEWRTPAGNGGRPLCLVALQPPHHRPHAVLWPRTGTRRGVGRWRRGP